MNLLLNFPKSKREPIHGQWFEPYMQIILYLKSKVNCINKCWKKSLPLFDIISEYQLLGGFSYLIRDLIIRIYFTVLNRDVWKEWVSFFLGESVVSYWWRLGKHIQYVLYMFIHLKWSIYWLQKRNLKQKQI